MSKQYGLIAPKKTLKQRAPIFEDSDSEEYQHPTGIQKSIKKQDKILQNKAIEQDPTVYQYDEVYDEIEKTRKESKLSRNDLDRKPKYISKLLAAADRRKKENERRIERQVQKERETEGDEFKNKESFVTSSYKKKLQEMKEMEELEKREDYLETIGDVMKQNNLDGFYRHLFDQKVNFSDSSQEQKTINLASDENLTVDTNKIRRKYRKHEDSENSDSQEQGKILKEHLSSNLDADSDFTIDSSESEEEKGTPNITTKQYCCNSTNQLLPEQCTEDEKTLINDVEQISPKKKIKVDIWKKRTVGNLFNEAVQRYHNRKAFQEL